MNRRILTSKQKTWITVLSTLLVAFSVTGIYGFVVNIPWVYLPCAIMALLLVGWIGDVAEPEE